MMSHLRSFSAVTLLMCLTAGTASVRADVVIVDPAGGPGSALLQAALDAAQPGDILLLRDGDYSGPVPTVQGKGLVLSADAGHDVELPGLLVLNVPAGQASVVRGLRVISPPGPGFAFAFTGSGLSWTEDCIGLGSDDPDGSYSAVSGLHVEAGDAIVVRCQLNGGSGADAEVTPGSDATPGRNGLDALGCDLVVQNTLAVGGNGGDGHNDFILSSSAGNGLSAVASGFYSVLGGSFVGGSEGLDNPADTNAGNGALFASAGTADVRDASFTAGSVNGVGVPGLPILSVSTTVTTFDAVARDLEISSPVRELEDATVSVQAERGDTLFLYVSTAAGIQAKPSWQGTSVLGELSQALVLTLGRVTDPSGTYQTSFEAPRLPTGIDGMVLYTQLGVVSAQGESLLGSGSAMLWISALL